MARLRLIAPLSCSLAAAAGLVLVFACPGLQAQAPAAPVATPATAPAAAPAVKSPGAPKPPVPPRVVVTRPLWTELTSTQQAALKPLASNWNTISEQQKRKWLALSQNYGSLPAAEQARLHERAAEWVALSPQQRSQARLNFGQAKELTGAEKQAKWEAYQALSADERKKLADGGAVRPPGAATPVKPVPRQKFTELPPAAQSTRPAPKIVVAPSQIDPNTLLPQPTNTAEGASGVQSQ